MKWQIVDSKGYCLFEGAIIELPDEFTNKDVAVASDMRRGLIPDYKVYNRRFGSMNNARKLAGVPRLINSGYGRSIEFIEN